MLPQGAIVLLRSKISKMRLIWSRMGSEALVKVWIRCVRNGKTTFPCKRLDLTLLIAKAEKYEQWKGDLDEEQIGVELFEAPSMKENARKM